MKFLILTLAPSVLFASDCVNFTGKYQGTCTENQTQYTVHYDFKQTACTDLEFEWAERHGNREIIQSSEYEFGRVIPFHRITAHSETHGTDQTNWTKSTKSNLYDGILHLHGREINQMGAITRDETVKTFLFDDVAKKIHIQIHQTTTDMTSGNTTVKDISCDLQ